MSYASVIEDAIKAERERCAKLVETFRPGAWFCKAIAAEIRRERTLGEEASAKEDGE